MDLKVWDLELKGDMRLCNKYANPAKSSLERTSKIVVPYVKIGQKGSVPSAHELLVFRLSSLLVMSTK
jgi:hypothetical protein